uniref:Uncharacterized protein n=1 Tax=Fagus sylvatica TaxID=28930 RepID=A0A2N9FH51_FAGSY
MKELLLGCIEKLKEISSPVIDQMKMIKKMQVNCQALRLASHGYEQEKPTKEDEFEDIGLEGCIEHVRQDTIVYLDDNDPNLIDCAYGRASRHFLLEEFLEGLAIVASGAAARKWKLLQYEVETRLASKEAMPFVLLKKKLFSSGEPAMDMRWIVFGL